MEVARAREFYALAESLAPMSPGLRRNLKPAEAMRAVYSALLDRVATAGGGVMEREVRISKPGRAWRAARIWWAPAPMVG